MSSGLLCLLVKVLYFPARKNARMLLSRCFVPSLRASRVLASRFVRAFASTTAADCVPCQQKLNFIDGQRCDPCTEEGPGLILVTDPSTGHVLCEAKGSGSEEVHRAVVSSKEAFKGWSSMSGTERGRILHSASRIIRSRRKEIAELEVTDNGMWCLFIMSSVACLNI